MSEQGLAARALAGARSLVTPSRRRPPAPSPVRTVADLVRDRARTVDGPAPADEAAGPAEPTPPAPPAPTPPARTPPAPPPVREPAMIGLLAAPAPEIEPPAEDPPPDDEPAAPDVGEASHVEVPDAESPDPESPDPGPPAAEAPDPESPDPDHPADDPVDPAGGTDRPTTPAPEPLLPPTTRDATLAPPWVRAALMGVDQHDPDLTAEQAAAGRALRRTFGLPRDPGPVTFAGTGATATLTAVRPAASRILERSVTPVRIEVRRPLAASAPVPVRFRVAGRDAVAVVGAEVTLLNGRGVTVTSGVAGPDGRGRFVVPHPDTYMLVASAPGHQPAAVTVAAQAGPVDVNLLLVRSASVSGAVRVNGDAVPDAQLTLVQDGEVVDMVSTGTSGRYRMSDLAGGEYALAVAADGSPPTVLVLHLPEEDDLTYDVDLAGP